ncbi:hypothetical protein AAMO2058_000503300 [Amorphochlora amoebiformis]
MAVPPYLKFLPLLPFTMGMEVYRTPKIRIPGGRYPLAQFSSSKIVGYPREKSQMSLSPVISPPFSSKSAAKSRQLWVQTSSAQAIVPSEDSAGSPSMLGAWIQAIRPKTLSASLMPVLVGHSLAWFDFRSASLEKSTLFWIFAVLTQIGTNLHNDYADYVRGADTDKRLGPARATQKGWISPKNMAVGATLTLTAAAVIAVKLALMGGGIPMIVVMAVCIFGAFAYTGGPYPLGLIGLQNLSIGYAGLGDVFTFFYFGLVPVLTTYWLSTGAITGSAIGFAAIMGSFASAIITVNNIRDADTDEKVNKLTSAVRFGKPWAKREYTALMMAPYLLLPLLCLFLTIPPAFLMPLISLVWADFEIRKVWRSNGKKLNSSLGGTARIQVLYTIFLLISIFFTERVSEAAFDFYRRLFLVYDPFLASQLKFATFMGFVWYFRRKKGQDPINPYAAEDDMD